MVKIRQIWGDLDAVVGVGPNLVTSFNPEPVRPRIGAGTEVGEFKRVVADVRTDPNSEVNDRAATRADEGAPIYIGANANIEEGITFHALEEIDIEAGDNLDVGDDAVLHEPLEVATASPRATTR